jgi:hypothetical protein
MEMAKNNQYPLNLETPSYQRRLGSIVSGALLRWRYRMDQKLAVWRSRKARWTRRP